MKMWRHCVQIAGFPRVAWPETGGGDREEERGTDRQTETGREREEGILCPTGSAQRLTATANKDLLLLFKHISVCHRYIENGLSYYHSEMSLHLFLLSVKITQG